jgi:hypothetical protein
MRSYLGHEYEINEIICTSRHEPSKTDPTSYEATSHAGQFSHEATKATWSMQGH